MEILLRKPTLGDIGWVISIHGEIYSRQFHFDSTFEINITQKVASFYEQINDFNILLIAENNGERVGSIAVSLQSEKSAFINFLLVRDEYRGRGVARKLMDKVIQRSRDYGLESIRLETYSCLVDARGMYIKYGFKLYESNKNIKKFGQVFDQEFWELNL